MDTTIIEYLNTTFMERRRGRKPLDKTALHARVEHTTPTALREQAMKLGYTYGNSGATGEMLDAIAEGRLVVVPQDAWEQLKKAIASFREMGLE